MNANPAGLQQVDLHQIDTALGVTKRAAEMRALKEKWPYQETATRGGRKRLYAFATLPTEVQAALLLRFASPPAALVESAVSRDAWTPARIESAWSVYKAASDELRAQAKQRLDALYAVEALRAQGVPLMKAREQIILRLQSDGVLRKGTGKPRVDSLIRWQNAVKGAPRDAWLAILLPAYCGCTALADCDPQAWDWYKGHYLTRAQPSHASTYRRLQEMATAQGWTIPSAKTLERRLDREVEARTQILMREGVQAVPLPRQVRTTDHFAPGEAVNGDGLKFDKLWVRFEDGEVLNTATAWFWQDLRTRKILAHRVGKTEHTDLFRLATYDLTAVCAPSFVWVDNTRVAANKLMTAGATNRHRYKDDPEDGMGLLRMLGMEARFTNPDKEIGTPGAKPIERAFGIGGLHEELATHPLFIGRGFSQATAIDVAELREVLVQEVARHNARTGRRTAACRGVLSFDQAWDEAAATARVRVLTESQRQLLLMCREVVRVDRTGCVTLKAGRSALGQNRYWGDHTPRHAGQKVAVHFDPEHLHSDVHLYGLDGRYLCAANYQPGHAFDNKQAGDERAKLNKRIRKADQIAAENATRMTALERKHMYLDATGASLPKKPSRQRGRVGREGNVIEAHFCNAPNPARDAQRAALARTGTDDTHPRDTRLDEYVQELQQRQIADSGWTLPET